LIDSEVVSFVEIFSYSTSNEAGRL